VLRALGRLAVVCLLLASLFVLSSTSAVAAESERPTISDVTAKAYEREATVEAQIDPQGSETSYEIWLECQSAHEPFWPCEPIEDSQRVEGHIGASFDAQSVSDHLTGLQPGSHYWLAIVATNSAGTTESRGNILIVSVVPPGACPNGCGGTGEQYGSEVPKSYIGLSNEESAKALREYEAKHQLQVAKEQEEQQAREAAIKTAEAAALKQREEEEAERAKTGGVMLADPNLEMKRGDRPLVKLECLGYATCRGRLRLAIKAITASNGNAKRTRTATIGSASFSIPGDTFKTVKLDMNAVGRALLGAARGQLHARLIINELPSSPDSTQTAAVRVVQQSRR